ncbi:hypothetical protein [Lysinibacillus sp. CTST325]
MFFEKGEIDEENSIFCGVSNSDEFCKTASLESTADFIIKGMDYFAK